MSETDLLRSVPLAAMLAGLEEPQEPEGSRMMLLFEVGGTLYALDAPGVEMIVSHRFTAPVPAGPPELLGVASVMGRMRLVFDLSKGGRERRDAPWRLIVLHGDAQLALAADSILGVNAAQPDQIASVEEQGCVAGRVQQGDRTALLLDPEKLFECDQ